MVTDTIGDFLTRIRNAQLREKKEVFTPSSKILVEIAKILKEEGFIEDFSVEEEENGHKNLRVVLKYVKGRPAITKVKRESKPGVRVYMGYRDIPEVLNGMGITILTTPKGLLTGAKARKEKVGGEYICKVW